jgi:RNA polymerase sigma factor (sigma-70 family)
MASLTQIELLLPELRAYSRSILQSRDEAEDLVQDAIERALRTDNRPSKLDELRPWMFRVIRNLSIDQLRKKRVRREYFRAQERLSNNTVVTTDVARDTLLRLAFEKLQPDTREILFLVDIMGMKYSEAAQVIGVPIGTVMSRISRARRALLELVDGSADAETQRKKN